MFELTSTAALTFAVFEIVPQLADEVVALSVIVFVPLGVPGVIVPKLQVSVPLLCVQLPASGPVTVQVKPLGSASVKVTLVEAALPPAVTTMVKLIGAPGRTLGVVVVFMTLTSGQFTVTVAVELSLLRLTSTVALTFAVLEMGPQLADEVVALSVIVLVPLGVPGVIVPKLQVSVVPPATGEAGKQAPASGPLTVQLRPAGKVSVKTTLVEVTFPPAVTVMLNLAVAPAAMVGVLVVLRTLMSGLWIAVTVTDAVFELTGVVPKKPCPWAVLVTEPLSRSAWVMV